MKPFHTFEVFAGLTDLGHYIIFAEIHFPVNESVREVPHVCCCGDKAAFFFLPFGTLLNGNIRAEF